MDTKGLKKLKELMLQTLVSTKYGVGWSLPGDKPSKEDFLREEKRVKDQFVDFITSNYASVSSFEKSWKEKFSN